MSSTGRFRIGEDRGLVVGLRVDEDRRAGPEMDLQQARLPGVAHVEPEGLAVEAPGGVDVGDGKAGERFGRSEHGCLLAGGVADGSIVADGALRPR